MKLQHHTLTDKLIPVIIAKYSFYSRIHSTAVTVNVEITVSIPHLVMPSLKFISM